MWDISELYAGEGLFAQLQPSSGPFLWRLQDAARVVLDLFNRGIGYGAAMWAVKLFASDSHLDDVTGASPCAVASNSCQIGSPYKGVFLLTIDQLGVRMKAGVCTNWPGFMSCTKQWHIFKWWYPDIDNFTQVLHFLRGNSHKSQVGCPLAMCTSLMFTITSSSLGYTITSITVLQLGPSKCYYLQS